MFGAHRERAAREPWKARGQGVTETKGEALYRSQTCRLFIHSCLYPLNKPCLCSQGPCWVQRAMLGVRTMLGAEGKSSAQGKMVGGGPRSLGTHCLVDETDIKATTK